MNRLFKTFGAALLIAALVSGALLAQSSVLASNRVSPDLGSVAQQSFPPTNSITVNGYGTSSGKPDVAFMTLGVEVPDSDPSKALSNANALITTITAAVSETGVKEEDIQTTNFNVYSRDVAMGVVEPSAAGIAPDGAAPQLPRTYVAQINISLKVRDISKVGAVIDAGVKAGANNIYGLSFGIDDQSKLEKDARVKAIANARSRAQELADALGVKLGDAIIIDESAAGGPISPMVMAGFGGGGDAASKVSEGQLNVGINVRITFSISK